MSSPQINKKDLGKIMHGLRWEQETGEDFPECGGVSEGRSIYLTAK